MALFVFGQDDDDVFFPVGFAREPGILSTDPHEGQSSVTLFPLPLGSDDMVIEHLAMLVVTANIENAGTDSTISLEWLFGENGVGLYDIENPFRGVPNPFPSWSSFSRGGGNIFLVPAAEDPRKLLDVVLPDDETFTKSNLVRVVLNISGDDAWLPSRLFLFGAPAELNAVVPLVALPSWEGDCPVDGRAGLRRGWLSTDPGDGGTDPVDGEPSGPAHRAYVLPVARSPKAAPLPIS